MKVPNACIKFAAENHHSELCKILNGAGADMSTLTHNRETAIVLAAEKSYYTTYAALSKVSDTLRFLTDSMDFSDESGDGWKVLERLCDSSAEGHGETEAKIALLLWMLKLSSFELKTYFVEREFAIMLQWVLKAHPVLEEASDLLLNLGGAEIIDAMGYVIDGYTILQRRVAWARPREDIKTVLSRGPDIHRLGFDSYFTPQQETPTSLAMYSEWVFADWLYGLGTIEVDLEIFTEQELERNHVVHIGWEKDTLLDLFAYDNEPDVDAREIWVCSDCTQEIDSVKVQPYWRHLLERIKRRIHPDSPTQHDSEARETENADLGGVVEAASSSSHLAQEPDVTENAPFVDLSELRSESESEWESESGSEFEFEGDIHGYPATVPIQSDCVYARHEVICMDCWIHYIRTGTRRPPHVDEYSPSIEESSEDEFSPYFIHS
ncbi:hypothetical protein MMC22_004776 [Lobaria immixta]|nr:hypothetical protein [Lobaria immixta]